MAEVSQEAEYQDLFSSDDEDNTQDSSELDCQEKTTYSFEGREGAIPLQDERVNSKQFSLGDGAL